MQDKRDPAFVDGFSEEEESFYTKDRREELMENDELEPWEEAWMEGYNSAE